MYPNKDLNVSIVNMIFLGNQHDVPSPSADNGVINDDLQALIENIEKINYDEEAKQFVYEEPSADAPKKKFGETWNTEINNKVSISHCNF